MKILMVNKFHYIKGGSETYYFALKNLLEERGHTVIEFSMKDEKNIPSEYENYFVENIDYNRDMSVGEKLKAAYSIIYSKEAKEKFEKLVKDTKPDLVHLHLFQHQLSPSILDVIKKYSIPTVYTAHELKMICPNYKMLQHGEVCEQCKGNKYYHCMMNKCVKDSFLKSVISTLEGYFHQVRKSYDVIDYIITPSEFYRKKFVQFGVDSERVVHIPNFLERDYPEVNRTESSGTSFLYFGRISEEKGISTLIEAARRTGIQLDIVGNGPLKDELERKLSESDKKKIRFLGFKSGQELIDIVGNAKAVIIPSEWYENGPYSAIEALQLGRPIIGADIGGIPELISENGYLFRSGDVQELMNAIKGLRDCTSETYILMQEESRRIYRNNYTSQVHYPMLMSVYKKALLKHR